MKILFVARHFTYFRNFESVIRSLAGRGHQIHLAVEKHEELGGSTMVERLAASLPNLTYGEAPTREADDWSRTVTKLRLAFDYLRYLEPAYDSTPRLRSRAAERAPEYVVRFGGSRWSRFAPARWAVRRVLREAERALPGSSRIEAFLRDERPDLMLITPLLGVVESPQPDYVRAARALGIPTALCVWSWDHLSSKALIRDMPDRVLVWNDVQRGEAMRLHGVPSDRIAVTGAQCFDHWFDRQPSRSRAEFCTTVGLQPDRPILLYVGSALFRGSPPEAEFVLRWIEDLRARPDPALQTAGILVRPHPQRMKEWDGVDLSRFPNVSLWGGNPVTEQARADYFDSLFHSAAVVGLNTSAFLEAGIAARPVLAILPPEFRDNQEGTIHFHYLLGGGLPAEASAKAGGLLRVSRTFDELADHVRRALTEPARPDVNASFVRAFIRPRGLDVPATPVFVETVEALGRMPAPAQAPQASAVGRAALRWMVSLSRSPRWQHWMMDEEDRRSQAWQELKARARAEKRAAKERALAEKQRTRELALAEKRARKRQTT